MNVLITYSSGLGSTKEVALEIARILSQETSLHIHSDSIDDVENIDEFEGIVVGSSVRADAPLANVRDFFNRFRVELLQKKVALFAVCLTANCPKGREQVCERYLSQILKKYPDLKPVAVEAFGGKIDFNRLNPVMQSLMRRVLQKTGLPTEGSVDTRDWEFIRAWAGDLAVTLKKTS